MTINFASDRDIAHDVGEGPLIVGYFTPNYRDLAMALADNGVAVGMNVHLYAVHLSGDWHNATHAQPKIMQKAATDHAGRKLICMDVDCQIRRDFDIQLHGDIAFPLRVKVDKKRGKQYTFPSTRIIVFRAGNARVSRLLETWCAELGRTDLPSSLVGGNEPSLMRALASSELAMQPLDMLHSAYEVDEASPDAVIVHQSAHDQARPAVLRKKRLKAIKRAIIGLLIGRDYKSWKYG